MVTRGGPGGGTSSIGPSQSLSTPSQISAEGAPGTQESTPDVHSPVLTQAPSPQDVTNPSTRPLQSLSRPSHCSGTPVRIAGFPSSQSPWQGPRPSPSASGTLSMSPSQSLSRPSQISAAGAPGTQESRPVKQAPVRMQAPTPQKVMNPSTPPSQLLSTASHNSTAPGWMAGS